MIIKKCLYCTMWSAGLFVATFYSLFSQGGEAFDFTDKKLLPIAQSHIMPMIMAMTLYLWDVLYNISVQRTGSNKAMFWLLLMIIVFMVTFVFSILVNCNTIGWILFLGAWLALTVLKYQTTEDERLCPYQILED